MRTVADGATGDAAVTGRDGAALAAAEAALLAAQGGRPVAQPPLRARAVPRPSPPPQAALLPALSRVGRARVSRAAPTLRAESHPLSRRALGPIPPAPAVAPGPRAGMVAGGVQPRDAAPARVRRARDPGGQPRRPSRTRHEVQG